MGRPSKWMASEAALPEIVRRIVERFDPEQIYLFGSQARGDARDDSDIDLLVVMPFQGRKMDAAIAIRTQLDGINIPIDVVVTTPDAFAWRKDYFGTIEGIAYREGRQLYARRRAAG